MDQENVMSDWKLNRMKKSDIIAVLRETETKLFGASQLVSDIDDYRAEINNLQDNIDTHKKTIQELNDSNKKLMDKIKFYQEQKENNKKRENKIEDYVNSGLIEKIKILENEKQELIEECKNKNSVNEELDNRFEKLYEKNRRIHCKCVKLQVLLKDTHESYEEIMREHVNQETLIKCFINNRCEECCSPTEIDILYCDFKEWCIKEKYDSPKRNIFKGELKKWQEKSTFGLDIGEKKSDAGVNGFEGKPKFNLKLKP